MPMQYHRIFSLTNSDSQILHGHDWIIATLYLSLKIHVVFEFNECQSFTEFWNRIPLYMLVMMNKLEWIFFFTTEHIPPYTSKGPSLIKINLCTCISGFMQRRQTVGKIPPDANEKHRCEQELSDKMLMIYRTTTLDICPVFFLGI